MSDTTKFDNIKQKISDSEKKWSTIINLLTNKLKGELKDTSDVQAEVISHRQMVIDETNVYGKQIYNEKKNIKKLSKERFEFYATSYQVKTSGTEKLRLIEADLADLQYFIDIYDLHCNYLQETAKNLDSIYYGIKQKCELYKILNGYQ